MTLREMMAERILFAVSEEYLMSVHQLRADEVIELSDTDLFELYEDIFVPA